MNSKSRNLPLKEVASTFPNFPRLVISIGGVPRWFQLTPHAADIFLDKAKISAQEAIQRLTTNFAGSIALLHSLVWCGLSPIDRSEISVANVASLTPPFELLAAWSSMRVLPDHLFTGAN